MNRSARRLPLFEDDEDYATFLHVLVEAHACIPVRILCYTLMPNHWHLVLWPSQDNDLSRFMAWLTGTHVRRWHLRNRSVGTGTIYQGRYKAIPVKDDRHFLVVCRYVERNPVRARLASSAEDWRWSSASAVQCGPRITLDAWPVARPEPWLEYLNREERPGEFEPLRHAIQTGVPFGPDTWQVETMARLDWRLGLRPRGRPRAA
jgi:putative transposase